MTRKEAYFAALDTAKAIAAHTKQDQYVIEVLCRGRRVFTACTEEFLDSDEFKEFKGDLFAVAMPNGEVGINCE